MITDQILTFPPSFKSCLPGCAPIEDIFRHEYTFDEPYALSSHHKQICIFFPPDSVNIK